LKELLIRRVGRNRQAKRLPRAQNSADELMRVTQTPQLAMFPVQQRRHGHTIDIEVSLKRKLGEISFCP
jgi:hypothetical protein